MNSRLFWHVRTGGRAALWLGLAAMGCSAEEAASPPPVDAAPVDAAPEPDVKVYTGDKRPTPAAIEEATDDVLENPPPANEPKDEVVIATKARIAAPPPATVGRDLTVPMQGHEGSLRFDIDGDYDQDDVYTFVPDREDFAFLAWAEDAHCHLAWNRYSISRYVFSECDAPAGAPTYVCEKSGHLPRSCQRCEGESCEPCNARIVNGSAECASTPIDAGVVPQQPDAFVEPPADLGPPPPVDGGEPHPDGGSPPAGPCATECMNQSGAVCCTTCACEGEVRCTPVCPDPSQWDCEMSCCFDYETMGCVGPS